MSPPASSTTTTTTTEAVASSLGSLNLRPTPAAAATSESTKAAEAAKLEGYDDPEYKYARFLPHFDQSLRLPPLEPFEHVDPGE